MRRSSLRAVIFVCLLSLAAPAFASPRDDASRFDQFLTRIIRAVRHILPLDTVDPTYPRP